jgi:predicted dehydrogenase
VVGDLERIRVGIVGCGEVTRVLHLPETLRNPRYQLVGLVDPVPQRARDLSSLFDVVTPIAADGSDLGGWDLAVIATPPHLHAELAVQAIEQGCHVLCEKPLATNREECAQILDAAQSHDRHVSVVMQRHYNFGTGITKRLLDSDLVGSIESVELLCVQRSGWGSTNPRRFDPSLVPGGVTFETGIHWLYRLFYWFNGYRLVSYHDDRLDGVEANAEISCFLALNGREVPCHMYFSADHAGLNQCRIRGSSILITVDDTSPDIVGCQIRDHDAPPLALSMAGHGGARPAISRQYDDIHDLIRNRQGRSNPAIHSIRALEFLLDCYDIREPWPQPWTEWNSHVR